MNRAKRRIELLCTVIFLSTAVFAIPKTADLLPADTAFLIEAANFSELTAQFKQNDTYGLYSDPAMKPFIDKIKNYLDKKGKETDKNNLFRLIYEAGVKPQKRLAIAMVLNPQNIDGNEPPFILISQWGTELEKIKAVADKFVAKNDEMGGHTKKQDYRGQTIMELVDEGGSKIYWVFIDDLLVAAMDIEPVKFVIAQVNGAAGAATLASSSDYSSVMAAVGPYHDIDVFVNFEHIIKTAAAADSSGQAGMAMSSLGVQNVSALGVSIGVSRKQGRNSSGKMLLKVDGSKEGICKILSADAAPLRLPNFLAGSTYSVIFYNVDIQKAYEEIGLLAAKLYPPAAGMMYMPLIPPSASGEPGIDLKTGLIDNLGSQIIVAESLNKPFGPKKMPNESILALAVKNKPSLEKSLDRLHSQLFALNNPDLKRELLGHTIYLFKPSMLPMMAPSPVTEDGDTKIPNMAFTVTNTHLIFGTEPAVENAIRMMESGQGSLAEQKWFNVLKSSIPATASFAGFGNTKSNMEMLWWMLKQDNRIGTMSANPFNPLGRAFNNPDFNEVFDLSLLPPYESVKKYFGASSVYGISRPDGFYFEFDYHEAEKLTEEP
ncbi:MAG: hypothetical protein PHF37_04160 [Phycisphaerae bacterium]|nr:hypothetical protein [Phycisphaerae bacterium]